jgi:hypothetical protein
MQQLLCRADHAGEQVGALCRGMHREQGETAVRRILGVLSLAKKYGVASAHGWRWCCAPQPRQEAVLVRLDQPFTP